MSGTDPFIIAIAGGVLLLVLALYGYVALLIARWPLKETTVDRFARRQSLELTPTNATHVVGALLITHTWRRAGLALGLLLGAGFDIRHGVLGLHLLGGFLGWFAGAVIAEWRIGSLDEPGERRAADLSPRGVGRFLTPLVVGLAAVSALVCGILLIVAIARTGVPGDLLPWLVYLVALGLVLALTARAIINRPSGFADPDLREADDALRCHGLTVLAGCGIAAAYPAVTALVLTAYPDMSASWSLMWTAWILIGCVALGWWVATKSPSARAGRGRIRPAQVPEDAGAAQQ